MIRKLPSLSIFFPAYNEEANIGPSIFAALKLAEKISDKYEILIVNDGSKDHTGIVVEKISRLYPCIKIINHPYNQGYGAAVRSGLQSAQYDYVFFTDADLQFDITDLSKFIDYTPKYNVVVGYRSPRRDSLPRLLNAKAWNILNQLLFGLKIKDIDCAFKLFRRDIIKNLDIKSNGAMVSAEILINLQNKKIPIKELPVTHRPRIAGSPTGAKLSVIRKALSELLAAKKRGLSARG